MLYVIILLLGNLIINLIFIALILNLYLKRIKETDKFFNELIKVISKMQIKINEIASKES